MEKDNLYDIVSSVGTDVGKKRELNEDNFYVSPNQRLYVVADGMGGHSAGEVASKIIRSISEDCYTRVSDSILSTDSSKELLDDIVHGSIGTMKVMARNSPTFTDQSGSTFTGLILDDDGLVHYAHMGDSRIYLFRDSKLTLMTEDHSMINMRKNAGKEVTPKMIEQYGNVVTKVMVPTAEPDYDHKTEQIVSGDVYLLCSDGLTDMVSDSEIKNILTDYVSNDLYVTKDILDNCVSDLISRANSHGGKDNITVALARVNTIAIKPFTNYNQSIHFEDLDIPSNPEDQNSDSEITVQQNLPTTVVVELCSDDEGIELSKYVSVDLHNDLLQKYNTVCDDVSKLETACVSLQDSLDKSNFEHSRLFSKSEISDDSLSNLGEKLEVTKSHLYSANMTISSLTEYTDRLSSLLKESEVNLSVEKSASTSSLLQIQELYESNGDLQGEVNSLQGTVNSSNENVSALKSSIENRSNQISDLTSQVRVYSSEITSLESNISVLDYDLESRSEQINSLNTEITTNHSIISSLKDNASVKDNILLNLSLENESLKSDAITMVEPKVKKMNRFYGALAGITLSMASMVGYNTLTNEIDMPTSIAQQEMVQIDPAIEYQREINTIKTNLITDSIDCTEAKTQVSFANNSCDDSLSCSEIKSQTNKFLDDFCD